MERNSKILIAAFLLIVAASVYATYHRYIALGDISFETDEAAFQESLLEE